jgi:hypothetical protein
MIICSDQINILKGKNCKWPFKAGPKTIVTLSTVTKKGLISSKKSTLTYIYCIYLIWNTSLFSYIYLSIVCGGAVLIKAYSYDIKPAERLKV